MKIFTALFPLVLVAMTVQGTEKQVQDLEKDIAALKAELEQLSGDGGTVTQMSENIKTAQAEVESTREALASKEKSIAGNEFLLGVYQSAFRVVTTLTPGTDLGIVQLSDGELLQGASFISADRGGILVQLPTGSRTVNVALLPDSFSDRVQLPPRTAPITMTVAALKQSKPDFLLTKEELAAAKSGNSNTAVASTGKNVGQEQGAVAPVAKKGSETEAANTFEEVRKRNEARQKQILTMKARYSELLLAKKKARMEKADSEKMFRDAKIKKSSKEIQSTLGLHDKKLQGIEEEEARLRSEMARIQTEFE